MAASNQAFKFCFFFKRIFKLRVSEPPEDIRNLFQDYSKNGTMSEEDLCRFLKDVQNEDSVTCTEKAQKIVNSLKHLSVFHRGGLHLDAFFRYLLGDLNRPISKKVHQDMDAPLAHYYLYTGHNSYLTGNQLSSKSSVIPIIKALRRGVRVIELDLWPNKKKTDVKVYHGGTMTSQVDLIRCLHAIKDNAFVASKFPVVITFEDHLNPNLQTKVAKMVTKVFGDMLYKSSQGNEFPSPNSLKEKILISTKPPEGYLKDEDKENEKLQKTSSRMKEDPNIEYSDIKIETDDNDEDQLDDGELTEEVDEEKIEYGKLIAIHATKLKGEHAMHKILKNIDPNKVSRLSMSEQCLENAVKRKLGADIIRFTQRNLLRVYPKGTRITSSNYNPFVGWKHGAQMVAFNMQGIGEYHQIMQGMFRGNGDCGYVKKPDFLFGNSPIDQREVKTILKVKIYHGEGWHLDFPPTHFDWCSPPDLYVTVKIAGLEDCKQAERTKTISNQWVPEWNQEFEFRLKVPELAMLLIEAFDRDDARQREFAGQTCLPISELKSGIRAVPPHDREGDQYKHTRLLARFQLIKI